MFLRLAACLLLIVWTAPLLAGAWPRGKGNGFLSLSYEETMRRGEAGAALGLSDRVLTEEPDRYGFSAFYAELGVTDRLTFGLDAGQDHGPDTYQVIAFAVMNVSPADWRTQIALELGLGQRDYPADAFDAAPLAELEEGGTETVIRPGLSLGRGFSTRLGDGWAAIDARVELRRDHGDRIPKIDTTLGIAPGPRSLAYLQLQYSDYPGTAPNYRLVPTYVFRPLPWMALESAILWDVAGGNRAGLRAAIWLEF
ncbi:hypothetical protein [Mangrovicoccus algicola]|uniref:Uncharacterized protein n=1 Tax=Mangrovicoccus algicola TaxID=2771008 RepID=A0A8J6Z228_9RHOB|nr:hypothetical protein [Mangrovicoccus algicola]MBE3640268.1 hypothetical protein [Mangrovicoccus algicola]